MVKIFGLTTDGLLPSKAKAEVEGIATSKAAEATNGVHPTAAGHAAMAARLGQVAPTGFLHR